MPSLSFHMPGLHVHRAVVFISTIIVIISIRTTIIMTEKGQGRRRRYGAVQLGTYETSPIHHR